jgi:cytochrome c553
MKKGWVGLLVIIVSLAIGIPLYVRSQANPHAALTYTGAAMCLQCHDAEARDLHASVHYQWQGHAQYMTNGPSVQGKLHTAFNSY